MNDTVLDRPSTASAAAQTAALVDLTNKAFANTDTRNIIYGESTHSRLDYLRAFSSEAHLDSLQRNGVGVIGIEMPQRAQAWARQLLDGSMSRDNFINLMVTNYPVQHQKDRAAALERTTLETDLLINSHSRGMAVRLSDNMAGTSEFIEATTNEEIQRRVRSCTLGVSSSAELAALAEDMAKLEARMYECLNQDPEGGPLLRTAMTERRSGDVAVGSTLSTEAEGRRVAVYYGGGHGPGIAQGLTGDTALIAGTYPDNEAGWRARYPAYATLNLDTLAVTGPAAVARAPAVSGPGLDR